MRSPTDCGFCFSNAALDFSLEPFLVFAQPATDRKARAEQALLLKRLKEMCRNGGITMGGFATDADSGDDVLHEEYSGLNLRFLRRNEK
jgi:hypothetical protein